VSESLREKIGDKPPIRRSILGAAALFLGAPTAFLAALGVRYVLVRPACGNGGMRTLLEVATLIVLLGATWVLWRSWQVMGRRAREVQDDPGDQPRFVATSALLLGGFCLLSGIALWLPSLFLSPCGRP
jgi:hypothetical protein